MTKQLATLFLLTLMLGATAHAQDAAAPAPADAAPPADTAAAPADAAPAPAADPAATNSEAPAPAPEIPVAGDAPAPVEQPGMFSDIDVSFSGFLRTETTVSATKEDNPANQLGNVFNGSAQPRRAYTPPGYLPATCAGVTARAALGALGSALCPAAGLAVPSWTTLAFPGALAGDASTPGLRGTFSANADGSLTGTPFPLVDNVMNLQLIRGEGEMNVKFGPDLAFIAHLRAVYDPAVYKEFDAHSVDHTITAGGAASGGLNSGGINGGDPHLYAGKPDYFDYITEGGRKGHRLEWTGRNYQIYLPTLVLDYNHGPLNVRIGNQQIAWGQALFFRVFD
ncbi:MAG TPA: DUF1302 family protein, partial [Nevskiaceae bacterium]|nr:DUF1302 family protein [Nevskiaceae bacterium]